MGREGESATKTAEKRGAIFRDRGSGDKGEDQGILRHSGQPGIGDKEVINLP